MYVYMYPWGMEFAKPPGKDAVYLLYWYKS